MALADLLLLLLLLLLLAPQAMAAPWRVWGAGEAGGNGREASWQDVGLEPLETLEQPGDPLQVNSFLAPYADLVPKPENNPTGPPRAKLQDEGRITTSEPSEVLRQIVEELRRGHGMDQEAVQSEAAPGGLSISGPVSAPDTAAMQDTDMPALSQPRGDQHGHVYAFYRIDSGTDKERSSSASNPQASFICPQDVRRSCMIGTAATVISVPLALVLCYCIYRRRKS
ncbi:uncharacterized protein LOC115614527 [Strigops habroptila]|uniref:uncharacterized protein LOC115614527 n=1 Tax=Strigops habroptila TaxID=2489341 RepID=UPI0011D02582|nr:uncharacterized protein LOC115614527 [Strigops habroptila]